MPPPPPLPPLPPPRPTLSLSSLSSPAFRASSRQCDDTRSLELRAEKKQKGLQDGVSKKKHKRQHSLLPQLSAEAPEAKQPESASAKARRKRSAKSAILAKSSFPSAGVWPFAHVGPLCAPPCT